MKAGVAVGTVAKVGDKDSLFLHAWEQLATDASLQLIKRAGRHESVRSRVWDYFDQILSAGAAMPEMMRDYFVAYVRAAEHSANQERAELVLTALGNLHSSDAREEEARLAASTMWLCYAGLAYGLVARTYSLDEARDLLQRIVDQQCAPFERKSK